MTPTTRTPTSTVTREEADEVAYYAEADIAEAFEFAQKEQYITAVNILSATTKGIERVLKAFPGEYDAQLKPFVNKATQLTMQIINSASKTS